MLQEGVLRRCHLGAAGSAPQTGTVVAGKGGRGLPNPPPSLPGCRQGAEHHCSKGRSLKFLEHHHQLLESRRFPASRAHRSCSTGATAGGCHHRGGATVGLSPAPTSPPLHTGQQVSPHPLPSPWELAACFLLIPQLNLNVTKRVLKFSRAKRSATAPDLAEPPARAMRPSPRCQPDSSRGVWGGDLLFQYAFSLGKFILLYNSEPGPKQ